MRRDRIAEKKAIMVAELDCLLADAKALRGEASSVPTPEFEKALINYLVARARQADELRRLDRYLSPVGKTFEQVRDELRTIYDSDPQIADPAYQGLTFEQWACKMSKSTFWRAHYLALAYFEDLLEMEFPKKPTGEAT